MARRLQRLGIFLIVFLALCGAEGALSIIYIFNVHDGFLPLRLAPYVFGFEAIAAAIVALVVATKVVPRLNSRGVGL